MHNQIRRVLNNGIGNRPRSLRFVWTVWNGCRRKSIPISAGCAGRSTIPGPLREQGIVATTSRVLSMGAACIRRFRQDARRLPIQVAAPSRADTLPTAGPVAVASGPAAGVDPVGVRVSARSWWVRPEAQRCRRLGRIQRHGAHAGRSGPAREPDGKGERVRLVWMASSDAGSSGSSGHLRVRSPGPSRGGVAGRQESCV